MLIASIKEKILTCDTSQPVQLSSLCARAACPVDESVVPLLCLDLRDGSTDDFAGLEIGLPEDA